MANNRRLHWCARTEPLRNIIERLAVPGVRRVLVLDPQSHQLEAIVSLSDLARFLFL